MTRAFLGLGSNLGDRLAYLRTAVAALDRGPGTRVIGTSKVYETAPVEVEEEQPDYLNCVVELECGLPATELLRYCQGIEAALDRELAFKCTAGLHHAVRRHDPAPGSAQHGFLNVLLATRASLDGEDAAAVLAETDREAVLARVDEVGADALARARRWFASFGCCGVQDPYRDLVALGLV